MNMQMVEYYKVVIVGFGFVGLGMVIKLKQKGDDDFIVFEKEFGIGGIWCVNYYFGCVCDVLLYLYLFFFVFNFNWLCMFVFQLEIKKYLEYCVDKYQVLFYVRLNCVVDNVCWNEQWGIW